MVALCAENIVLYVNQVLFADITTILDFCQHYDVTISVIINKCRQNKML